jgi:large subunit ribosomal protein L22
MQVRAKVTNIRVSPRKARLVVDAVRGKRVMDAIAIAKFLPQRTAEDVEKLLRSVAANAENNFDLDPEDLWIKEIYADGGRASAGSRPRRAVASGGYAAEHPHHGDRRGPRGVGMGRKVNPIGFRLGIVTDWESKWYAERNYTDQLHEISRSGG